MKETNLMGPVEATIVINLSRSPNRMAVELAKLDNLGRRIEDLGAVLAVYAALGAKFDLDDVILLLREDQELSRYKTTLNKSVKRYCRLDCTV